jgi:hypothetical protein
MDDFSDLAARIGTSVGELRGCLILSRDGLVLGSYPEDDTSTKPAWIRFATMGDPEKAFIEYPDELWAYVRRGPFAAFAVAGINVRPGLLLEQLEQAILVAEGARSKRESLRIPDVAEAPKSKPRTSLHPEPRHAQAPPEEPVVVTAEVAAAGETSAATVGGGSGSAATPDAAAPDAADETPGHETPDESEPAGPEKPAIQEEDGEVDRVLLAQEFSRLLQETGSHDEETP